MEKIMPFVPATLALLLYMVLGCVGGFGAIHAWVWVWIAVLFLSAVILFKGKWYGCIGGLIVGGVLISMSMQYTGQVIDIERPFGIILCVFYLANGIAVKRVKG